jgi:integrase
MGRRSEKREFQCGDWWLGTKSGRPGYYRCKLEGRQIVRISLGTSDIDEAKERLTAWFLARQQGPPPHGPISLAEVLLAYDEAHGKRLVSAADVKSSSRLWAEYFRHITAADACDLDRIEAFKAWLAKRDYTPGYINRILSVGRAALMRAYKRRLITVRPMIKGIAGYRGPPKGRPLALSELRRFYNALREPHTKRFFILGIGTGGRPDAILSLDWTQIDLRGGSIRLNAFARIQTSKRRAEIPICAMLAQHLLRWGQEDQWVGPLIRFRGRSIASLKKSWRNTRERTSIDCNPYSLRHTVGKWLRSQGVPPWEVAALLGHKMPGYSITEMYANADPSHMKAARAALDKLLRAVCVPPTSAKLERAMGFEPMTPTLGT